MKRISKLLLCLIAIALQWSCAAQTATSDSSDVAAPEGRTYSASAITSLFSSLGSSSSDLVRMTIVSDANQDVCGGLVTSPDNVDTRLYGSAGTYGAVGHQITVTAEDFCTLEDGTANAGTGPDGNGRLAQFRVGVVTATCAADGSDDTYVAMRSGMGIYRNTEESLPEIYGTFTVAGLELDCTIYLGEDGAATLSVCTDEAGDEVESVDSENATCTLSTEITAPEFTDDTYRGIWSPGLFNDTGTDFSENPQLVLDDNANFMGIMVSAVVFSDGSITLSTSEDQIAEKILDFYDYGINVLIALDTTYEDNSAENPLIPESVTDTEVFQANLEALVLSLATLAEEYDALMFAPYNEADLKFESITDTSAWGQEILPLVRARYSGKVLWKAGLYISEIDTTGYDIAGISISPAPQESVEDFQDNADQAIIDVVYNAESYGVPETMISEFGVWGGSDNGLTPTDIANAYDYILEHGIDAGITGFNAFDGPAVYGEQPLYNSEAEVVVKSWYGTLN